MFSTQRLLHEVMLLPQLTSYFPQQQILTLNKNSRSAEAIVQDALGDRYKGKKSFKEIEFGRGTPRTSYHQNLCIRRLDTFRQFS